MQEPNRQQEQEASSTSENNPLTGEQEALASLAEAMKAASGIGEESAQAKRIVELEQENAELRDRMLRAAAEVENIRRRSEKEQQDTAKYAVTSFARDLISVFENLSRASASISEEARRASDQVNNLAMGVELTLKEMQNVLEKHHVRRIDPTGQPFDHNFHQAMTKVPTAEYPEGTVMQVMQAAYVLHERLLQPAMVVVATAPAEGGNNKPGDAPQHVDTEA